MADRRDRGGEGLGRVDAGRREPGRHAHADQQGARNLPEGHAERAIDQLRGKADQDERDQGRRVGEYRRENMASALLKRRDLPNARASGKRHVAAVCSRPAGICGNSAPRLRSSQARGDRRLQSGLDRLSGLGEIPRSRRRVRAGMSCSIPASWALGLHRVAHWLWEGQLYFLARLVNHFARFLTAIDIHPGAKIGKQLLPRPRLQRDRRERRDRRRRHHLPARDAGRHQPDDRRRRQAPPDDLRSGVVIGSGAQVLGPIEVGEGAKIGANSVVTKDVAPRPDGGRHPGQAGAGRRRPLQPRLHRLTARRAARTSTRSARGSASSSRRSTSFARRSRALKARRQPQPKAKSA